MRRYISLSSLSSGHLKANRSTLPYVWAEGAEEQFAAADPDLDTEHLLYIPDRYIQIGWQFGDVEPEQWQNFLQQISDLKIKECMEYGFFNWFDDVEYKIGALCFYEGVLYESLTDKNAGNTPSTASEYWDDIYSLSSSSYSKTLSDLSEEVASHINATGAANPHQDDAETIGGYTQAEIDNMFSAGNPDTMAHHIADMDNPHNETYLQLNTLPISGGTFKGVVCFSGGIVSGSWKIGYI